ncbi:MAG: nucleoside hydrolase [Bacteroidales bacterium]|jgi:pyrimidine-specific ribonucleoside hydrolase|nr:nucleoside hydrolase [Bacteroidales bacterium]
MKRSLLLILGLILNILAYSHPWKPSHYVIVDTDGGIDDMRAITMLLASPDIRVLAVTVSPGALNREKAYIKIKSLLNSFYHEGIPVGINRNSAFKSPEFTIPMKAIWGDETGINPEKAPDCFTLIDDLLSHEKTRISFLCLGGMSTAEFARKNIPLFRQQVKEIIWSSNGLSDTKGFNYNIDPTSSLNVLKGEIPVKTVRGFGQEKLFNEALVEEIRGISTKYGEKFYGFFSSEVAKGHDFLYFATDETLALFLQYPEYFKTDTSGINSESFPSQKEMLMGGLVRMLKCETVSKNQVIKEMPVDPEFYFDDIQSSVNEIILKFGVDEWTSGVLANELHRHLGVFAIVGVKMGIRAREYFNTGVDEFSTTSFAGSLPPLSCMNDGIQVSTGATPGHGLLTVRNDTVATASAEFTYMNRKIRLTLKPEIAGRIISELKEINFVHGLDSNIYWELVRKNSIKYWSALDRHVIFLIEELY